MSAPSNTLTVNINGRDNLSPVLSQMESKLIRFVGAVSSAMAALKVASFPVTAAADFEREMANVKKTTEFTAFQIGALGKELEKLSLRVNVSAVDLAKIAAAAGQQGLGKIGPEGIAKFTESISRMASVLDITAEQAANDMGKIMNIFATPIHEIENAVSAFNEASNNSTASGEELLNVVRRIGDAAGTINLKESLGLAATGIDFGMSPEVVGTSYGKIFADMRAKADEFAKLMKMDSKQWIKLIDTEGGIAAYKKYLERLRQLDSASQARAISELSGRGRIFSLVNKNVQDKTDSVLNKNLNYSKGGYDSGESAIKEQRTVLETLKEQFVILKNSIFKLSTEAGEGLLSPLTAYVARLSAALQQPAVKSFVQALGKSMLDLLQYIDRGATVLGNLNVNWENLITVAKTMIGLKLLGMFTSWATGIKLVSSGTLQLIAAIRGTTAAQVQANAAQAAGAGAGGAATLAAIINQWRARKLATQEATAAEAAHAAAARANAAAEARASQTAADLRNAEDGGKNAKKNLATASANTATVANNNAQAIAALEQRKERAEAAAIKKRDANISAIEEQFKGKRSAADRANRDALIAAENAHYSRQLGGLNSAAARRLAVEKAAGDARLAAAQLHEAQMTAIVQRAEAARLAARGRNAAAQALLDRSNAQVRQANENLLRTRAAADAAGGAMRTFGMFAAGAGALISGAIGIFAKAFFWLSAIYMIADAMGATEKIGAWAQKLGDALGLSSEAARKAAQASKERKEKLDEEIKQVNDLAESYSKLKSKATGEINQQKLTELKDGIKNGGKELQTTNVGVIGDALLAGAREVSNSKFDAKAYAAEVNKAELSVDQLALQWEKAKQAADIANASNSSSWRTMKAESETAKAAYDEAIKKLAVLRSTSAAGLQSLASSAASTYASVSDSLTGMFTYASLALFNAYIVPITAMQEQYDELNKKRLESEQAEKKFDKNGSTPDQAKLAAQKAETEALAENARKLASQLAIMRDNFKAARDAFLNDTSIPDVIRNSIGLLDVFADQSAARAKAVATALNNSAKPLTGLEAPKFVNDKTTGEDKYEPKAPKRDPEDSESRKLAKAKLALARAEFDAESNLQRAQNDQYLEREERKYAQGLVAIEDYFENRRRVMLSNNQAEIKALELSYAEVDATQARRKKDGAKPSELVNFDKDKAVIAGQIAVLKNARTSINREVDNGMTDAYENFSKKMLTTKLSLVDTLGAGDLDEFFNDQLKEYNNQWKEFLLQLEKDGGEEGKKLAKQLRAAGRVNAVEARVAQAGKPGEQAMVELDQYMARLDLLNKTGKLTTADMEKSAARARKATAAVLSESIAQQEKALATLDNVADKTSGKYQQLANSIEESRIKLETLQSTANQVALGINRDIGAGIKNALTSLTSGRQQKERSEGDSAILSSNESRIETLRQSVAFLERASQGVLQGYDGQQANLQAQLEKSRNELNQLEKQSERIRNDTKESVLDLIKRSAKEFGISMTDSIRNAITSNLAESAMGFLGGENGDGGIGGFFAGILSNVGELGGSKSKPMWVKNVDATTGSVLANGGKNDGAKFDLENPISSGVEMLKEKAGSAFDFLSEKVSSFAGNFGDVVVEMFSGIGSAISGILSAIMQSEVGQQAGSWIATIASSFFHTGGVVGMQRTTSQLHPSVFMGAARYHTGGLAGLRPDEVPAILQRGEEVLTANDPRHRDNGGMGGVTNNVNVSVNMDGSGTSESSGAQATQLGKAISQAVQTELTKQLRAGGLLYGKR